MERKTVIITMTKRVLKRYHITFYVVCQSSVTGHHGTLIFAERRLVNEITMPEFNQFQSPERYPQCS